MPLQSGDKCWAVLPAAGIGSRMKAKLPKQYLNVAGATVLEHSLSALLACEFIERVVVVISPKDTIAPGLNCLKNPRVILADGGEQRSDSVLAGLLALKSMASTDDWVLVHDAARPCVSAADITRLAQRVCGKGVGGILAVPLVDTIKKMDDKGLVDVTVDREMLWCAQTPQMFRLGLLRAALNNTTHKGLVITDEASAMELSGEAVQLVEGSHSNLKVTVASDLPLVEFYLGQIHANTHT